MPANGYGNGLNPNSNMWQYFTKFKMLSAHAIMGVKSVGKKTVSLWDPYGKMCSVFKGDFGIQNQF